MTQIEQLRKHLIKGKVYRRAELANWSSRHLNELLKDETLQKLNRGLYHFPADGVFGKTPPEEKELVRCFLNEDKFLLHSLNAYNSLGVGTTQLYNERIVYNHKRHGAYKLGNQIFHFRKKVHFPKKVTEEFLIVDLVNNIDALAEDPSKILKHVISKIHTMNKAKLRRSVAAYGNRKAKKIFAPLLQSKRI
jgi:hypothetical protein